ncbi:recombinase family protein [Streptomyces phyllanthi]|uniref:Recombinase family protein n=1 Tax=Streptomyces phyllanthi TaxID=1803180 RepID=A0A5N8VZX4_9ACTN|nr:recombinase family protein [Streptomyces phyllanthi]MPY39485.1 recombinase family protein [Streptomyces phyllanthi]
MTHLAVYEPIGLIPVVSYARTSEDVRQRDGHGVRYQLRINERTAHEHACEIVATYVDNGRSASRAGVVRPGFDRLIADLARGLTDSGQPVEGVVCTADDRLYRRAEDLARFLAALTSRPGRIYVDPRGVRDPYAQEGLFQAVRSLEAAVTETHVRSQRLTDWHWARAVEGVPHSGPRPFGWQEDRITLRPNEAQLVERAILDRIGGKAVRAIARDWCDLGVTGTRGGRPNAQTVTQIMTAPRVCGYRANRGELLLVPETRQPVLGQWEPVVPPTQWHAVCATFSPGSLYLHRGSGAPRLTGNKKTAPRHLATGFLRCGAERPDGSACRGALCAQKGRSRQSPYVYTCRSCGRCSISGPLADEALERLLFSETQGRARLSGAMRQRWQSGEMGLEEKREIIASAFICCIVRPGLKGTCSWDHARVEPMWRCADRTAPADAPV